MKKLLVHALFFMYCCLFFAETAVSDSKNRLRFYDDEKTQTILSRSTTGIADSIIADNERYVQKKYDNLMRTVQEIIFYAPVDEKNTKNTDIQVSVSEKTIPPTYASLKEPTAIIDYVYTGNNPFAEKITETDFIKKSRTQTQYSRQHVPIRETAFTLAEGKNPEKELYRSDWNYDNQNRLIKKSTTKDTFIYTVQYTWLDGHTKPNQTFYENGVATAKNIFTKDGKKLEEYVYFPAGIAIKTIYVDGIKNAEFILDNERVVRERKFE